MVSECKMGYTHSRDTHLDFDKPRCFGNDPDGGLGARCRENASADRDAVLDRAVVAEQSEVREIAHDVCVVGPLDQCCCGSTSVDRYGEASG